MSSFERTFVAHSSIILGWCFDHAPNASFARDFLVKRLKSGKDGLITLAGLEFVIQQQLVSHSSIYLSEQWTRNHLYHCFKVLRELADAEVLMTFPLYELALSAYNLSRDCGITFNDGIWVSLVIRAETHPPLLVADEQIRERLLGAAPNLPESFDMVWLPDYVAQS